MQYNVKDIHITKDKEELEKKIIEIIKRQIKNSITPPIE